MIKILFVCHGNICRSPMAEFIFSDLVRKDPLLNENDFDIASAAVSREEIGCDMYPPARDKLKEKGIPYSKRKARQITRNDYDRYDFLIGMDEDNLCRMERIFGSKRVRGDVYARIAAKEKMFILTEFAGMKRPVADPWYTDDFETAYRDIRTGCEALLKILKEKSWESLS